MSMLRLNGIIIQNKNGGIDGTLYHKKNVLSMGSKSSKQFKLINAKPITGYNVREITEHEFPSVVCIGKYDPEQTLVDNIICTGSIIALTLVLTTETCFTSAENSAIQVIVGSRNLTASSSFHPIWWLSHDQWALQHPQIHIPPHNDILVAKVFGFPNNVIPILVTSISPISQLYGLNADIVGCGRIDNGVIPIIKHTVSLRIMSSTACNQVCSYFEGRNVVVPNKFICTVGLPYAFLDYGDAGGPLIYFGTLIGINLGVHPVTNFTFHPGRVNLHVNFEIYNQFFNHIVLM